MLNINLLQDIPGVDQEKLFLGRGTFGYVTKKLYAGTPIAVKFIKKEMRHELKKEVDNLSQLSHPNIVSMLAHNEDFIVMELADGTAQNVKSALEISIIGRDCMRALTYMQMHGNCLLHLDIKPANILVYKHQGVIHKALLGDIGLATACNKSYKDSASSSGYFVGTPGYMPDDEIPLSGYDDVFALAVSLLDAFTPHLTVATSFRKRDWANTSIDVDNTHQINKELEKTYPDLAKIIGFMLTARTVYGSKADIQPLQRFMLSLVNGFDLLVQKLSSPGKFKIENDMIVEDFDSMKITAPLSP